ncbi:MAG: hypothetical protein J1G07_01820 [Clostridiales bacterium]|nr:hypothetical protein [Clostridiales bacterium]
MNNTNPIKSNEEKNENFENNYKMLLYFQDEYKYRHKHFWDTLKMFFTLNITISLLPFISGFFNYEIDIAKFPIYIFPIIGICTAIVSSIFLKLEMEVFNSVARKKFRINELFPKEEYKYEKLKTKKISIKIILTNLIFQIFVAAGSLTACF